MMLGILDRLNETEVRDLDLGQATSGEVDFEMFMRTYVRQRFAVFDTMGFDVFRVILSELLWVWLPCVGLAAALWMARRRNTEPVNADLRP